jgi:hypothetical protein
MSEVWLPVRNYEGYYEVSNHGRVRSVARKIVRSNGWPKTIKETVLCAKPNRGGYLHVGLSKDGVAKTNRVHRLVMDSFFPTDEALDVNHKDGDRANNRLENLEWVTRTENHLHAYRTLGRTSATKGKFGRLHHRAKAVIGTSVKDGAEIRFDSLMDANRSGFRAGHICSCIQGKRARHKGYTWREAA